MTRYTLETTEDEDEALAVLAERLERSIEGIIEDLVELVRVTVEQGEEVRE